MEKPEIILAEPPVAKRGRRGGKVASYIETLRNEYPGQWALYTKNAKHASYFYTLKKNYSDLQVRTARTEEGTDVYLRVNV
jgi:hypothetical protein